MPVCLVLTLCSCTVVITVVVFCPLCPQMISHAVAVPSTVQVPKHAQFCRVPSNPRVSTEGTPAASLTHAVQTHRFAGAGELLFQTPAHIWRRWGYANTRLLRPQLCPNMNILAFLPLPSGQHWRHSLAETPAPRGEQQSQVHTVFMGNFHPFPLPEERAPEGMRPLLL